MNDVSRKLTIAVAACLKQWSKPQCVANVLKQSFSMSQRAWPHRHSPRVDNWVFDKVVAQDHVVVCSVSCHCPAIRSRCRTVSSVRSTRSGRLHSLARREALFVPEVNGTLAVLIDPLAWLLLPEQALGVLHQEPILSLGRDDHMLVVIPDRS